MPVSSCFGTPFRSKRVHGSQKLLEPPLKQFDYNFPLIQEKLSWKISGFFRCKNLGLFGNTLTSYHICARNRWQVQTVLSQKLRTFSAIFITFLESKQNFAHSENKDQLHSLNILEVIDSDKRGYFSARQLPFQNTLRQ